MKQRPEIRQRKATTILLDGVGWRARKIRPQEKCFFLDSFYRTNQELTPSARSPLGPALLLSLLPLVVSSLCSEQEKRTMREPGANRKFRFHSYGNHGLENSLSQQ